MPRYRITTLIDITRTDAKKSDLSDHKKQQQANFDSLRQSIEMRSIVSWYKDPSQQDGRLPAPMEGRATHWIWEFETERDDLFLHQGDPVALLKTDLQGVPVISGLDETAELAPSAVQTQGNNINTVVEIV